jgi:hypothetical protein
MGGSTEKKKEKQRIGGKEENWRKNRKEYQG